MAEPIPPTPDQIPAAAQNMTQADMATPNPEGTGQVAPIQESQLAATIKKPNLPIPDDHVTNTYVASEATKGSGDPWAYIDAKIGPSTKAPSAQGEQTQPAVIPPSPNQNPPSLAQNLNTVIDQAHQQVAASQEAQKSTFTQALTGGLADSLKDLAKSTEVAVGNRSPEENNQLTDFKQPFDFSDGIDLASASKKAIYQLAHGAPTLAGGIAGGVVGSALGAPEGGIGAAPGALIGGGLGAGAVSAAQSLNGYFQGALKANPADPDAAFHQALKQAGTEGVFSAAGWMAFGAAPFEGVVKNLLFQAAGVQPAIGATGQLAQNLESGQPVAQGVPEAAASSGIMSILPAIGHAVVKGLGMGSPQGTEAPNEATAKQTIEIPGGETQQEASPETKAIVSEQAQAHVEREAQPIVDHTQHATEEFRQFSQEYDPTALGTHDAARNFVMQKGAIDGNEHAVVIDNKTGLETQTTHGTNGNSVQVPNDELKNPDNDLTVHHNHTGNFPVSSADIENLSYPGLSTIVAHSKNGDFSAASLTEQMAEKLKEKSPEDAKFDLSLLNDKAFRAAGDDLQKAVDDRTLTDYQARNLTDEIRNRALANNGVINYTSSHFFDEDRYRSIQSSVDAAVAKTLRTTGYNNDTSTLTPGRTKLLLSTEGNRSLFGQIAAQPEANTGIEGGTRGSGAGESNPAGTGSAGMAKGTGQETGAGTTGQDGGLGPKSPIGFRLKEGYASAVTPETASNLMSYLNGETKDNPVQASSQNWNNPLTREDITRLASYIPPDAVRHDDAVKAAAYSNGMTVDDFLSQGYDRIFNDNEMAALKMAKDAMSAKVGELANQAVRTNDPNDWDKAMAAMANARDMEDVWKTQGRESARTLRQRRGDIDIGNTEQFVPQINKLIANTQYENDFKETLVKIAQLKDEPEKISPFIAKLNSVFNRDNIVNAYYQVMLSNPEILTKKLSSDVVMAARDFATNLIAEKAMGAIPDGTTTAKLNGTLRARQDAFIAFSRALKEGQSQFHSDWENTGKDYNAPDDGAPQPINDTADQSFWSYMKQAMKTPLKSFKPTSVIGAADDMAKTFRIRGSQVEQLYIAGAAKGLEGDKLTSYVDDNMNSGPPDRITKIAAAEAQRGTLQEPLGPLAQNISEAVNKANINFFGQWPPVGFGVPREGETPIFTIPAGKVILPFIRIGANTMRESSVIGRASPIEMLSNEFKDAADAGGVPYAKMKALIGVGTAFNLAVAPFVLNNTITGGGPTNPEQRAAWLNAGNRPYSINAFGKWWGYRWIEPIGFDIGLMADTHEIMKFAKDEDAATLGMSIVRGVGHSLLNASYLWAAGEFMDWLVAKNPNQASGNWFKNAVASMAVPSGINMIDKATDPYMRQHQELLDTIKSRTPGLSETLHPVIDTWGDPIKNPEHLVRGVIPMEVGDASGKNVNPIDKWIWDHYQSFPNGPQGNDGISKPSRTITHSSQGISANYRLNDDQYYRYLQLAGNKATDDEHNGLGAKDYLNALVKGNNPDDYVQNQWNEGTDEKRALLVHQTITDYRKLAKAQLMQEFPEVGNAVNTAWQSRANKTGIQ